MLRSLSLALLCALAVAGPALGQEVLPLSGPAPDSVVLRAQEQAYTEASHPVVGGYFLGGFVGGVPLGLVGPVALLTPCPTCLAISGGGAGIVIATLDRASRRDRRLPAALEEKLRPESDEYRQAFRAAYTERLAVRRKHAGRWGAGVGTGIGVGLFGYALWGLAHLD